MHHSLMTISEIRSAFPDQWVLVGNPQMDEAGVNVRSGIPLYGSRDKTEVCYIGRDKIGPSDAVTLIYTGTFKGARRT